MTARLLTIFLLLAVPLTAPSAASAKAKKKKKPHPTYVWGLCAKVNLCRVDAKTRKSKFVARAQGDKEYNGVAVSPSGRTMVLDYGNDMIRAGRNGRQRRPLDGFGFAPFVSPSGRSVGWVQSYTYQSCVVYPYYSCLTLTDYAAATQSLGETESTNHGSGVFSAGWYREQLMVAENNDDETVNGGTDFICTVTEDSCVQTLAADPTRALSSPSTSPDGRYLAVVSEPKPAENADQKFKGRIEIWNPATAQRVRVLTESTEDDTPIFSPDGKRVAFQRGADVLSMAVRGGRTRLVGRDLTITGPSWARG